MILRKSPLWMLPLRTDVFPLESEEIIVIIYAGLRINVILKSCICDLINELIDSKKTVIHWQ
jgi:hypothetical protein